MKVILHDKKKHPNLILEHGLQMAQSALTMDYWSDVHHLWITPV